MFFPCRAPSRSLTSHRSTGSEEKRCDRQCRHAPGSDQGASQPVAADQFDVSRLFRRVGPARLHRIKQRLRASREPLCDQSNSAAPSRYGLGWPSIIGIACMPIFRFGRLACDSKRHQGAIGENPRTHRSVDEFQSGLGIGTCGDHVPENASCFHGGANVSNTFSTCLCLHFSIAGHILVAGLIRKRQSKMEEQ